MPAAQEGDQGQGQIAVGDGAADFAGGALDIHMDPLVVAGGFSELVDPLLADLHPIRNADFLADQTGEVRKFNGVHLSLPEI